ncbi:MAG TPA: hypothetical protein VI756_31985 [Blastocatellia bacterium]
MAILKNMVPYDLENLLKVAGGLFEAGRAGDITPHQFCKLLTDRGVTGPEKIMYIHETFGIPIEVSKGIWLDADYQGGQGRYWEDLCVAIDDASKELRDRSVFKEDTASDGRGEE